MGLWARFEYPCCKLISDWCLTQVKLDFGSSKLPRRELLEEDASMDFVFIPPETKERVLTEHQKEVKRTKRQVSHTFKYQNILMFAFSFPPILNLFYD